MKNQIKKYFLLFIILLSFVGGFSQTTLYTEDFSTNDGKGKDGTTLDVSGVSNWTINISTGTFSSGDWFKVINNYFESYDTDAASGSPVYWYSTETVIDCYTNVTVSVDLGRASSNSGSGCIAQYSIDGGAWTTFGTVSGTSGAPDGGFTSYTQAGLSGSTIQIRVGHWGTSSTPKYRHDNVSIVGTFSPSTPASNLVLSNYTGTSIDLSWTNGSGNAVLVVARENGTSIADPNSGTSYSPSSTFGSGDITGAGNYVVYNSTGTSLTIDGLTPGTDYAFSVYTYNTGNSCYNVNGLSGSTLCSSPGTQVSGQSSSSVSYASLNLSWTNGSGDKTLIVARINGTAQHDPASGTSYTANSSFGAGDETGTDNFVVYNGTGTSVSISGLAPGTNYIFSFYTYNSADNCYNTTEVTTSSTTLSTTSYEIDVFNGSTIITCGGTFTDSNPSGNYTANEDNSTTFCSEDGELLKFSFSTGRIAPGDTLYLYNGPSISSPLIEKITGNAANAYRLPYFEESSSFSFISPGTCITFQFVTNSDATTAAGWSAAISCYIPLTCGGNEPASDLFGGAPYVCNINGYCGITSGDFDSDVPADLHYTGGSCPSALNFLGTVENNSWIKFIADATTAEFDFEVPLGGTCLNGIQTAIFAYDGSSLTRMSDCSMSDGSHSGSFTLTATGLTVGDTYYIMTDGNAGDICNYTIFANTGVAVVYAGADQTICNGEPVTLSTSGPSDATYVWNSLDGEVVNAIGYEQTFSPLVTTTYVVEITGGDECLNQTDTIVVNVSDCLFPVEFINVECKSENQEILVSWETVTETNNDYFTVQKSSNGKEFKDIERVEGAGNSTVLRSYSVIDKNPSTGINYYRIKQTDYNGLYEYSKIVFASNSKTSGQINVYYSENTSSLIIELEENKSEINYSIYDISGRKLSEGIINAEIRKTSISTDFLEKTPSLILITLGGQDFYFNEKILVK